MKSAVLISIILCLIAILGSSSGLKCYKCTSGEHEKCKDHILKDESLLVDCNPDQTYGCIKSVVNGQSGSVIRRCANEGEADSCKNKYNDESKSLYCFTCDEDGCNGYSKVY